MRKFLILPLIAFLPLSCAATFGDQSFTSGPNRFPPTAQTIGAGGIVAADGCGTMKQITSAGSVTTDTTNTFTAPADTNRGCVMFVCNVGSQNIILDNNANFKSAAAGDITMTGNDCLLVTSNGTAWYQATPLVAN